MHISSLVVLSLAYSGALGTPLSAPKIINEAGSSIEPSVLSRDLVPVESTDALVLERAPSTTSPFRTFTRGVIVILGATYMTGDTLWQAAIDKCTETVTGQAQVSGVLCVYRCIEVLFKFAWWWRVFNAGNAESILGQIAGNGNVKRDVTSHTGWSDHWNSLNASGQAQMRALLPPSPGFWMHSLGDGSPDIAGSATFHYAADGAQTPMFRHVTNGTHGFVHNTPSNPNAQSGDTSKRAVITQPGDTYDFGSSVVGFKLSYIHPCTLPSYGDFPNDADLAINDFVEAFLQNGADKYAIEMEEKNDPVMYGSLIVEGSGFGMNYEGIDFTPPNPICRDEL